MIRGSRPEESRKKGVLKDLQEHTCVGVSFLIALFKTESNAGAFLLLQNFSEHLFYRFPMDASFRIVMQTIEILFHF